MGRWGLAVKGAESGQPFFETKTRDEMKGDVQCLASSERVYGKGWRISGEEVASSGAMEVQCELFDG